MSSSQRPRVLRILEEYVTGDDATPWWTTVGDVDEYGYLDPDELRELGLSDELIRDGRVWNEDWDAAATAAMDRDDEDLDPELRRRGIDLARRTVEEVPDLWVLDPADDWHIGAEQPSWPLRPSSVLAPALVLGVPGDEWDSWPWYYRPRTGAPDWFVPLPWAESWGERVLQSTEAYAAAMAAACTVEERQHAWQLANIATQAMVAAIWPGTEELAVLDGTGRTAIPERGMGLWPRRRAKALLRWLRTFTRTVQAPQPDEEGWFAYAPLSDETFGSK